MSATKEHPDKHLIETLNDMMGFHISEVTLTRWIPRFKAAIKKDEEAHRLFCKEVVRKKIDADGKPVEGSEFNDKP